jgi:hypothetical protein
MNIVNLRIKRSQRHFFRIFDMTSGSISPVIAQLGAFAGIHQYIKSALFFQQRQK